MTYVNDKKYRYRNLTGNTAIEITSDFDYFDNIFNHFCLANIHTTDSVNVDLYSVYVAESIYHAEWEDKGHVNNDYTEPTSNTETYYYMKNVTIPVGVTYASFAGLCIIATTLVGVYKFNQMPDIFTLVGLVLIVSGVLIVNLLGKTN